MTISVSSNNGNAPSSALAAMPGRNGDGSQQTSPIAVVESYGRLRAAMQAGGLGDLVPSSGWSCYRNRAAQQHMRNIGLTTIPVGQSIHGEWSIGGAVDFSNLGGFGAPRHNWLRGNGGAHGWYQPGWATQGGSLPEPWHWEYDSRNDSHAGEEPEDMSFTDADRNMLANTNALLQETPFRSAQQVMSWQISRFEGAPTSFLQDQTDGVTNTYTLVSTPQPTTSSSSWSPRQVVALILAVAVVLLEILAPFIFKLSGDVQPYLGIVGILSAAVAALVGTHGWRESHEHEHERRHQMPQPHTYPPPPTDALQPFPYVEPPTEYRPLRQEHEAGNREQPDADA